MGTTTTTTTTTRVDIIGNAVLDDDEEERLPLHAAVKFGDQTSLIKELARCCDSTHSGRRQDINACDSHGRTAMCLATLTGQVDLMDLIAATPGAEFKFCNASRMRAIAKRNAPRVKEYLEDVMSGL